jgi:hypothetical protein
MKFNQPFVLIGTVFARKMVENQNKWGKFHVTNGKGNGFDNRRSN